MEKIKLEQEIHSTKIAWIKTQKDKKTIMFEAPMSPLNQTIRHYAQLPIGNLPRKMNEWHLKHTAQTLISS